MSSKSTVSYNVLSLNGFFSFDLSHKLNSNY